MTTLSIHQVKTHLSSLINAIENTGETVIIAKHGRPVAELVPVPRGDRIKPDPVLKKIAIKEDLIKPTEGEWENV